MTFTFSRNLEYMTEQSSSPFFLYQLHLKELVSFLPSTEYAKSSLLIAKIHSNQKMAFLFTPLESKEQAIASFISSSMTAPRVMQSLSYISRARKHLAQDQLFVFSDRTKSFPGLRLSLQKNRFLNLIRLTKSRKLCYTKICLVMSYTYCGGGIFSQ